MKQHYGLYKKELRKMTTDELINEYHKWKKEKNSFSSGQTRLICQRVMNRIVEVYNEKLKEEGK